MAQRSVQNSLVAEIKEAGGEAVAYKANVADFTEAEGLIKFALEQYGRVDILVNNAGITKDNIMLGMKKISIRLSIST